MHRRSGAPSPNRTKSRQIGAVTDRQWHARRWHPCSMSLPPIRRSLRVFVAGGSGFVGHELIVRLVRAGHSVSLATRDASHADDLLPLSSVEVSEGDVYSLDFLRAELDGCDLAVNLVGILNEPGRGGSGFRRAHVVFTQS